MDQHVIRSRLEHDYSAEISSTPDLIAAAVSNAFSETWDLTTRRRTSDLLSYSSYSKRTSLRKAFLAGIPASVEWTITPTGTNSSKVQLCFSLPSKLRLVAYLALLVFFVFFCPFLLSFKAVALNDPYVLLYMAVLVLYVCSAAVLLNVVCLLQLKYVRASRNLLRHIAAQLQVDCHSVSDPLMELHGARPRKLFIDWRLFTLTIVAVGIHTWGMLAPASHHEFFDRFEWNSPALVLAVVVFLLILVATYVGLTAALHSFAARLLLPSVPHLSLCLGICLLLLAMPLAQEGIALAAIAHMGDTPFLRPWLQGPRLLPIAPSLSVPSNSMTPHESSQLAVATVIAIYAIWLMCLIGAGFIWRSGFHQFTPSDDSRYSQHQISCEQFYSYHFQSELRLMSQPFSRYVRTLIWLLFCGFSAVCWSGVLLNISILNAFLHPDPLPGCLYDGFVILNSMELLAKEFAPLLPSGALPFIPGLDSYTPGIFAVTLGRLLAIPSMVPFIVFISLHVYYGIRRYRRAQFTHLKGDLRTQVDEIAKQLHVGHVCCMVDEQDGGVSPYTQVTGIVSRNTIVFTPQTLTFLQAYPEYAEPTLAHEIGHLKKGHCRRIRLLEAISRLGLVGAAFLWLTLDSVAMEEEADEIAQDYLEQKNLPADLIGDAAKTMEVWESATENRVSQSPSPLKYCPRGPHCLWHSRRGTSTLKRLQDQLRVMLYFYFEPEPYHYIRRKARLR